MWGHSVITRSTSWHDTASALRREFDESFARLPSTATAEIEDLIAITVGAAPYVVRVTEIAGLFSGRRIEPIPTSMPGLIGLTGVRGAMLAVYDLRVLLGEPDTGHEPRWMVTAGGTAVGLAFTDCNGFQRVPSDTISGRSANHQDHVREVVHLASGVRPILSVASILSAITHRVGNGSSVPGAAIWPDRPAAPSPVQHKEQ